MTTKILTAAKKRRVVLVSPNIAHERDEAGRIALMLVCIGTICPNPLNGSHGHWRTNAKLRQRQRLATMHVLARIEPEHVMRALGGPVTQVCLVRLGPGTLDDDAVPAALKSFRDQFAAWWAHDNTPTGKGDDGPKCGIAWTYRQERQLPQGVRIEVSRERAD